MVNKTINKINLFLLCGLCLGLSSTLYAANQNQNQGDGNQTYQQNSQCTSIQDCKAFLIIIKCLQYWDNLNNTNRTIGIFKYLSSSNGYISIIAAYHHLLNQHLSSKNENYAYINKTLCMNGINCDFDECISYTRNQKIGSNEDLNNDDKEYLFLRDLLDNIHAYLLHGYDSGHRYNKQPKDDSGNEASPLYTLFDKKMAALQKWQNRIKKKGRNQEKDKFNINIKQNNNISFELLKIHFKDNPALIQWLTYLRDNACDTDVLLHYINIDDIDNNILANGLEHDKDIIIIKEVVNFIDQNKISTASYSFGVRLNYWDWYKNNTDIDRFYNPGHRYCDLYVSPTYTSFKNEILAKNIRIKTWEQKIYEARQKFALSPTLQMLKACDETQWEEYGIKRHAALSIQHMLSILFYTDFTALCTAFGKSLRYLSPSESLKDVKKRNSEWYYLSRYLREVVECFGTKISDEKVKGDTYYHGASYLLFTQFSVHWYGPLSTSKRMEVATLFSTSTNNDGLVLELKEDDPCLRFFNVSLLSCFSAEDERLFIGGRELIQIASIRLLKDNTNLQQIMHALYIVDSMIKGYMLYESDLALPIDAAICKDLCAPRCTFPIYVQDIWHAFRHQQQSITINTTAMYDDYKALRPLLCSSDPACSNILLLDKIAKLFPNATEIICKNIGSNFISGVQDRLRKINNYTKLRKIIIEASSYIIKNNWDLYVQQFSALEWKIGKGSRTIVIRKGPYKVIFKEVIAKFSRMIEEQVLSYEATSLDVPILNKLILQPKDIPADVQKQWNAFRHQQQRITINMCIMYRHYKAFMPLFFNMRRKNLLLLDKIAKLFPNVTEIICKGTDWDGDKIHKYGYQGDHSPAIVCPNFMVGLQDRLSKVDKYPNLRKIVITTSFYKIGDGCHLYTTQFTALGWQVQKDSWDQISLTKLATS